MKICIKCNLNQALKTNSYCKDCNYSLTKEWKKNNKEREKQNRRRNALKTIYGLSLEDYDNILLAQNGKCAICSRSDTGSSRVNYFHVDHCHETGKVRGLLCNNCNRGIGYLGDNIDRLAKVIQYLRGVYV